MHRCAEFHGAISGILGAAVATGEIILQRFNQRVVRFFDAACLTQSLHATRQFDHRDQQAHQQIECRKTGQRQDQRKIQGQFDAPARERHQDITGIHLREQCQPGGKRAQ